MLLTRTNLGWWAHRPGAAWRLQGFSLDDWLRGREGVGRFEGLAACGPDATEPDGLPALPVESQEIWAAGVTYLRSKKARMEESDFSATAYDRVYEADRPELFYKANARRCAAPGGALRLRDDAKWNVPEPELVLVISADRSIVGFTIGDDLSSRDIEGENLLYLPQAKVWDGCCAVGPSILLNDGSVDIRASTIRLRILRDSAVVFEGATEIARIKRSFDELAGWLFRNQSFPDGVMLLTGTGVVPPDDFTLQRGDEVRMTVPEIGTLINRIQ